MKIKKFGKEIKNPIKKKDFEKIIIINAQKDDESQIINLLKNVSIGIWRIRKKINDFNNEKEQFYYRDLTRYVDSILDILNQSGVEIKDYTGEKYDNGMALHVIAFQPISDIKYKIINETIKPTIYYKNKILQTGEVIVGIPIVNPSENNNIKKGE